MNANFKKALEFTLQWEGGKSDDKVDRGGRTNKGITQIVYNAWRADKSLEPADVWTITQDEVEEIYHDKYWIPCRCDQLPDKLDMVMFDSSVNHGPRKAVMFLQRASGVVDDGDFGPQTLRAVNQDQSAGRLQYMLSSYLFAREKFYAAIVHNDPRQVRFLKGWLNRLNDLRQAVGAET